MPKGSSASSSSSKSSAAIQRLLEERRQYEAWLARLRSAADSTPEQVRTRVQADYTARLRVVMEELKVHAEAALQLLLQRKEFLADLQKKEAQAAERLTETELRHAVGEYDEAQWTQIHKDALAELLSVREELQALEEDIEKLGELNALVSEKPASPRPPAPERPLPKAGPPPRPQTQPPLKKEKEEPRRAQVDELAFLKSVTEDEKGGAPSPQRASGTQFQPVEPGTAPATPVASAPAAAKAKPPAPAEEREPEPAKTLKCQECGTMNLATEWYCEQCGAELAAL
ncbi:MAG: zinc ribbon domain-containing protein [Gemmatimonadetes bacterium]|nr:zinc ribbon domain-containing protein [Gemmatimonadota bacterium]